MKAVIVESLSALPAVSMIIVESSALPDDCEKLSIEKAPELIYYIRSPECVATPDINRNNRDWEQPRHRNNYKSRRRR